MKRLHMRPFFVNALPAATGGTFTDSGGDGSLVLGHMICLRGTAGAGAAPVNVRTDLGRWWIDSAVCGNLLSESNWGFVAERTRALAGSIHWINNVADAGDPIELSFFQSFDLDDHGNVYSFQRGDEFSIFVPPVAAAVMAAGSVWELYRIEVDRGTSYYIPRFKSRGLTIAEQRFDFSGKTGMIQMQDASVTAPARIAIFSSAEERHWFSTWQGGLAITNARDKYGPNEATEVVWKQFSGVNESVIKCFGTEKVTVEFTGGAGTIEASQTVVEPLPGRAREISEETSLVRETIQLRRAVAIGGQDAVQASAALISGSSSLAPTPAVSIPITPDGMTTSALVESSIGGAAESSAKIASVTPGFFSAPVKSSWASRVVNAMRKG